MLMKRYPITTVHGRLQFVQPASRGTMEPFTHACNRKPCCYALNVGSMRWFHLGKSRGTHGTTFVWDNHDDACTHAHL